MPFLPVPEGIGQLALSVSSQVVVVAVAAAGLALVLTRSEAILVLALLTSYIATAVLLASQAAPELAFVMILIGIFVALIMQLTAAERRAAQTAAHRDPATIGLRVLATLLIVWFSLSIGVLRLPLQPQQFTAVWLVASATAALLTTTDAFRVGIALLMLTASSLLYYATSTSETSLLVLGLVAGSAFAISLAASHLALEAGQ
ncbi:MAG: hypothetical protein HPY83_00895 [Anaerolineae bacterium]|nr:hypothetical protein [Anaerolineae bacterium]